MSAPARPPPRFSRQPGAKSQEAASVVYSISAVHMPGPPWKQNGRKKVLSFACWPSSQAHTCCSRSLFPFHANLCYISYVAHMPVPLMFSMVVYIPTLSFVDRCCLARTKTPIGSVSSLRRLWGRKLCCFNAKRHGNWSLMHVPLT